jgi:hypothetical protein
MKNVGKLRRYINGREVTKWFGELHNQFQCAQQSYYRKEPHIDMKVVSVGFDVEYHIVNKKLEEKWLGE